MELRRKKGKEWQWVVALFSGICGEALAESLVMRWLAGIEKETSPGWCSERLRELKGRFLMFMEEREFDDILRAVEMHEKAGGDSRAG